jgi:hypothetical protein
MLTGDIFRRASLANATIAEEGYGLYYLDSQIAAIASELGSRPLRTQDDRSSDAADAALTYQIRAHATLIKAQILRTKNGFCGWVPRAAQYGDIICLFACAVAPWVLREKSSGEYMLVGDAYVHGAMYGETLEGQYTDWKGWQQIVLV